MANSYRRVFIFKRLPFAIRDAELYRIYAKKKERHFIDGRGHEALNRE